VVDIFGISKIAPGGNVLGGYINHASQCKNGPNYNLYKEL
jgi:hypothetical protein